jgi:two-component system, OmpR family, phosphate regulon sensor histidine kinase PhoR
MKRIFTVIVVLITLSLLGIIALQVSWFKNLEQVQEQRLLFKVEQAGLSVANDLSKYVTSSVLKRPFPDKPYGISATANFTLSQLYTAPEIREKLTKAFEANGLKKLDFEFALIANGNAELQSRNFFDQIQDTINNKQVQAPVLTGSDIDGLIPTESLQILIVDFQDQVYESLTWMIFGAVIFTIIILTAFYLTVRTLLAQKKLSEIKSDFINNMTHEFKTPLATISLAVDALKNEKVQHDKEKMQYFSGIIKEENKRMNKHVETILQAALMDKQELKLNLKPLHAHEIISRVVDNFRLQLEDKQGKIELTLNAKEDLVKADEVHFTNLVSNLIDNAIKYSKEDLYIRVYTHCTHKHFIFRVEDNGIGMSKESVKRIFEKFYRAHTGNIHNVKGFGLGMSYVKTVVDAHRGRIKVDSTLGKGSVFTVEIPVVHK